MSTTYPIKNEEALEKFKNYYLMVKPNYRNYALVILGLNTAFRIGDLLKLRWTDIYNRNEQHFREHISVREEKTGKERSVAINDTVKEVLLHLRNIYDYSDNSYLFFSHKNKEHPISRSQAYRIVKEAGMSIGLDETISCHSLRKTFGYHAWKQGVQPAILMDIYNHSSYRITKRYLSIEQDDRDNVYLNIKL